MILPEDEGVVAERGKSRLAAEHASSAEEPCRRVARLNGWQTEEKAEDETAENVRHEDAPRKRRARRESCQADDGRLAHHRSKAAADEDDVLHRVWLRDSEAS